MSGIKDGISASEKREFLISVGGRDTVVDGISASEKREFLISVGGRDTVRRILFDFPDLLD